MLRLGRFPITLSIASAEIFLKFRKTQSKRPAVMGNPVL